jgi:AraC family transcriptional regulator, positive regulator of tynA and feaB
VRSSVHLLAAGAFPWPRIGGNVRAGGFNIKRSADVTRTIRSSTSLNLEEVEEDRRAETWQQAARNICPGLTVEASREALPVGSILGKPFGPGQLWRILSPPVRVDYDPAGTKSPFVDSFSVMLQLQGATIATQGHQCELARHDICLIDGSAPFHLEVAGEFSQMMFLRMPRHFVLSRYPWLKERTARCFESGEAGTTVLRSVLTGLLESAAFLDPDQCMTALVGAACLLGVPKPPPLESSSSELNWRARSAMAYIDAELADPSLNAARVAQAQGISRRRLDEILLQTVGTSLNAHIWTRRLEQAATDLRDSRYGERTVTDIAFSVGFVDAAHFARSFKRRYLCSPRDWRSRN